MMALTRVRRRRRRRPRKRRQPLPPLVEVYLGILGLTERPNVELKDCSD